MCRWSSCSVWASKEREYLIAIFRKNRGKRNISGRKRMSMGGKGIQHQEGREFSSCRVKWGQVDNIKV